VRRRRGAEDRVVRHLLGALAHEPGIRLAYPTTRLVRDGAVPGAGA
jgi:hypothetical protein